MINFHDIGESPREIGIEPSSKRKEKYYPSLRLTPGQLPGIKNWKVGNEYTVMAKLRQTSYEKRNRLGSPSKEELGFDIRQVAVNNYKDAMVRKLDRRTK